MTFLKTTGKWIIIGAVVLALLGYGGYRFIDYKQYQKEKAEQYALQQEKLAADIAKLQEEIANEEKEEVSSDARKGITIVSHVMLLEEDNADSKVKQNLPRGTIFSILEDDSDSDYIKVAIGEGRQGYVLRESTKVQPKKTTTYYAAYDYSDLTTNPGMANIDLAYYQQKYPGCVGYIYGPGTVISYPVMWTGDHYYLHHDLNGNESVAGAIYLAPENQPGFSDSNSILYGHHMKDGSMFQSICGYKSQSYYNTHPVLYLYTSGQNYRIEVVAGLIVPGTSELFTLGFSSANWNTIMANTTFTSRVGIPTGRTITLCTCTYEIDNGRYILIGSLVPIS